MVISIVFIPFNDIIFVKAEDLEKIIYSSNCTLASSQLESACLAAR